MIRIIVVLILLSNINSVVAQGCNNIVSGHVIDADVHTNLANANVTLVEIKKSTTTNSEGNFSFANICVGSYTLIVSHIGCKDYSVNIKITKSEHYDVELPHTLIVDGEAVVSALKQRQNTGVKVDLVGKALEATRGTSLADAMGSINGVALLQTGSNVSKPMLHGLSGNRLLIINNGVRQEGQQWGNEHAPEIDPFLAEKITVLKGVDELQYGSDAIGGVILIEPKSFSIQQANKLDVFSGFSFNNKLIYTSAIFQNKINRKPFIQYRVQGTFKKGANSKTPNYSINNTGLQETNGSITLQHKKGHKTVDFFGSTFNTTLGVFTGAHIGNITDLQNAIAATMPNTVYTNQNTYKIDRPKQEVAHQLAKIKLHWNKNDIRRNLLFSVQRNNRKEFDIVRNSNNKKPQLELDIITTNQDYFVEHKKIKKSNGTIGLAATQQINNYIGRYIIPNYTLYNTGAYVLQKWNRPHWEYQLGVRADYKLIATKRLKFNTTEINHNFKYATVAASGNTTYNINNHLRCNIALSYSSRAPYVNELLSDGIHHGTATYELGNINLKTEKSLFFAWNWNYKSHNQKFNSELNLHYNNLQNFIFQQPIPNAPVLTIAGAFPKIEWQQTNAFFTGVDATVIYQINNWVQIKTKVNYLYAKNKIAKDFMIGVPPYKVEQELQIRINDLKKWKENTLQINWVAVAEQKNIPANYLLLYDYKIPPNRYQLWNATLSTNCTFKNIHVQMFIVLQNIGNTAYRNYLNSFRYYIDETGRNISLKIKISILNK